MELATARIPVRSRREAMDWSLVLISQGIESTIEYSQERSVWELEVSTAAHPAALLALRQYQAENRHWRWRQKLFRQGILFDWVSLAWVVLVVLFYWVNESRGDLRDAGVMESTALAHGQWWRLFTAMWLHADLAHLAGNATFGLVFLGLAMGRYGTGSGLLAAYLAGAGGNLAAGLLARDNHTSLGASGMVMGAVGLLAIQAGSIWGRTVHGERYALTSLFGGIMLFVLLGLTPGTDVVAHFGGFGWGVLLGALLSPLRKSLQEPLANLVSGLMFALLVVLPWWLAFRH